MEQYLLLPEVIEMTTYLLLAVIAALTPVGVVRTSAGILVRPFVVWLAYTAAQAIEEVKAAKPVENVVADKVAEEKAS